MREASEFFYLNEKNIGNNTGNNTGNNIKYKITIINLNINSIKN
jgi:hypothetical protein